MRILHVIVVLLVAVGARAEVVNLDFGWRFTYGDSTATVGDSAGVADSTGYAAMDFDDSGWMKVNLPHDFQIAQPWVTPDASEKPDLTNSMANIASRLSSRGFKETGTGWYRRTITPDPQWQGKRILLDFEGIMLTGDVYLNGRRIGGTDYGYLGFEIDVTDLLHFDRDNILAVRADTGEPGNSRWYTGGGLYRNVRLKIGDPDRYFTRKSLVVTTPEVSADSAVVVIGAEIASQVPADSLYVGVRLLDANGKEVYASRKSLRTNPRQKIREVVLDSLTLTGPTLWDVDNPYIYKVEATVYTPDGEAADQVVSRFGIRKIEYSPEYGFRLNGRKLLMKGIANHHTLGALGAAAYPRAMEKRLKMLKDFGFNHVRTSHNPYSESFLDLCDSLGFLVVDELYDKWTTQYAGGRRDWNEQWLKDIPEWVKRDRNHPSVVMWSLGNELQLIPDLPYNDWGVTPYRLQKTLLNRYDTSRPVTVAMHPRGRNEFTDSLPAPLALETDIAAYNYRYMYFPSDSRRFPGMIFYQSEANASMMGPNWFDMDLDRVIGAAYWGMIDYLGESKGWPAKGWTEGVFDISLQPKPLAYFLRSYFKPDEPTVHIGIIESTEQREWNAVSVGTMTLSENWNRLPYSSVNLYTFTNGAEVELLLNGRSLGRKPNDTADSRHRNRILWENLPYEAGTLTAISYDAEGNPIARHTITTAGAPVSLRLEADNPDWRADGYDLQHILVTAIDADGNTVYGNPLADSVDTTDKAVASSEDKAINVVASSEDKAINVFAESVDNADNPVSDDLLQFEVEGPAEIIAVINGDLTSPEPFTGTTRSLTTR